MTAPSDDTTTDLHAVIAELRAERDAGLAREATLAEELAARDAALAQRNSEYGERIEQQSAAIDVLKVMSASPGDPQPVFDLITHRARELCGAALAGLFEFDSERVHLRSSSGSATALAAISAQFPMRLTRGTANTRAILEKRVIHVRDVSEDAELSQVIRDSSSKSVLALPLMRGGLPIGSMALNSMEPGGFSDSQIALLQTFAEQAVIAITSAETYRALQERTAALAQRNSEYGERIDQQSATIDVLKAMSASPGDARPVFQKIVERARELCGADQAATVLLEGDMLHLQAEAGMSGEVGKVYAAQFPRPVNTEAYWVARFWHARPCRCPTCWSINSISLEQQARWTRARSLRCL